MGESLGISWSRSLALVIVSIFVIEVFHPRPYSEEQGQLRQVDADIAINRQPAMIFTAPVVMTPTSP